MTKVSAVYRINFIQRTRIARKAAGFKVKTISAALGILPCEYRIYESREMLPAGLLPGFAILTRVSVRYMIVGEREPIVNIVRTRTFNGITTPVNKCGAPCPFGPEWCHLQCLPTSD